MEYVCYVNSFFECKNITITIADKSFYVSLGARVCVCVSVSPYVFVFAIYILSFNSLSLARSLFCSFIDFFALSPCVKITK